MIIFGRAKAKRIAKEVARSVVGALEAEYLNKPQAAANADNLRAVAEFARETAHLPELALRIDTILFVKIVNDRGVPAALITELTGEQVRQFAANPHWLTRPHELIRSLGLTPLPMSFPPPSAIEVSSATLGIESESP